MSLGVRYFLVIILWWITRVQVNKTAVECNKSTRRAFNSGLCKLNAIHKNPDSIHGRFFVGSQYNGPHEIDRHAAFNRFTFVAFLYYPITPFIVFAFIILPGRGFVHRSLFFKPFHAPFYVHNEFARFSTRCSSLTDFDEFFPVYFLFKYDFKRKIILPNNSPKIWINTPEYKRQLIEYCFCLNIIVWHLLELIFCFNVFPDTSSSFRS